MWLLGLGIAWSAPMNARLYARYVEEVERHLETVSARVLLAGCPQGEELLSVLRDLRGPWPGRGEAEAQARVNLELGAAQIASWNSLHPSAFTELRRAADRATASIEACLPGIDPFVFGEPGRGVVTWAPDLASAQADAAREDRRILLFASAPWKLGTAIMDTLVWNNGIATDAIARHAVALRAEWPSASSPPALTAQLQGYFVGTELPTVQIFDAAGVACEGLAVSGFVEPDHLVTMLLMARGEGCHNKPR